MKKIGIAMATFNGEKYIEQQLNSIIGQTMPPDVLIISDGNSSDNTVSICRKILSSQTNIEYKIIENDTNMNVTDNFQRAITECDTKYIFFCDQDDVWKKNKIEITINSMKENNAVMAFTNASIVDENLCKKKYKSLWDSIGFNVEKMICRFNRNDMDFVNVLIKHNVVTGMCMCINKDIKEKSLPFVPGILHDSWITFVALFNGNIVAINEETVLYRQHKTNQVGTSTNTVKMLKKRKKYVSNIVKRKNMIDELKKRNSNAKNCEIINNYSIYLTEKLEYFEKKKSFLWPLKNRKRYNRFEYDSKQIIIKDLFCRVMCRKLHQ